VLIHERLQVAIHNGNDDVKRDELAALDSALHDVASDESTLADLLTLRGDDALDMLETFQQVRGRIQRSP
jgi:hypothetical protein